MLAVLTSLHRSQNQIIISDSAANFTAFSLLLFPFEGQESNFFTWAQKMYS